MRISIGCDHAGFEFKEALKTHLENFSHQVKDNGCFSKDSVDYPDFAHEVALQVGNKISEKGILICGSANGVAITANKHAEIRAAIAWNVEIAKLSRQHNDANIICIPARFISLDLAKEIVNIFLETDFEGGRHQTRIDKITR